MKKRITALALASTLLLSGCSSLLERDFYSVTTHSTAPVTEGDTHTLRAENHQELVNALMYFVTQHQEKGTVRLYTDWANVNTHLEDACLEVVQEDPLGAYAVEFIKYSVSPLVTYSEAQVEITYRRSKEQIEGIQPATGTTMIRSKMNDAFSVFASECVLRIGYFDRDEAYIRALAHQSFYDSPATALDFPDIDVNIYPDHGRQRVVELKLRYHLPTDELSSRKTMLAQEIVQLGRTVPFSTGIPYILETAKALLQNVRYDPKGGSTAWHALTDGTADSEGLALAFAALCQHLHIPCQVAEGYVNNEHHFWNVVSTIGGWRHMDLTRDPEALMLDSYLTELGYTWSAPTIPRCVLPDKT